MGGNAQGGEGDARASCASYASPLGTPLVGVDPDKNKKESQNCRNQGFSYYFCMMIEGSGSIPLTNGSVSGKLKNMLIRWIRIRNTALKGPKHEILVAEFFYTIQAFTGRCKSKPKI